MISKRNIVCLSNPSWDGDYAKTIVELMNVFAEQNNVLYVENAPTIKDFVRGLGGANKSIPLGARSKTRATGGNGVVHILTPPVIFTNNFLPPGLLHNLIQKINNVIIRQSVKKYLKKHDMRDDLISIVAFNPAVGLACGRKLNEKLLIYHCYDEIRAANWLKKHGPAQEKAFMKMADATIVTSQGLYNGKKQMADRCYLVKNAVNADHFSRFFSPEPPAGAVRIGYVGSIDDRLDYDLLSFLFENLPAVVFEFVGRLNYPEGELILRKYDNVVLHGPQPVDLLPEFIAGFSAGIIPFAKNDFTKAIYPLKINEYLACGIPVISTDFSYLDDSKDVISISGPKESFLEKLISEIENDNAKKRHQRLDLAKTNSWHNRVTQTSGIIEELESKLSRSMIT